MASRKSRGACQGDHGHAWRVWRAAPIAHHGRHAHLSDKSARQRGGHGTSCRSRSHTIVRQPRHTTSLVCPEQMEGQGAVPLAMQQIVQCSTDCDAHLSVRRSHSDFLFMGGSIGCLSCHFRAYFASTRASAWRVISSPMPAEYRERWRAPALGFLARARFGVTPPFLRRLCRIVWSS